MNTLLEHIKKEWAVLKKAPMVFVALLALGVAAGVGPTTWFYSGRLAERDDQIHRYRVALGIDRATEGTLVELSSQELQLKSVNTASRIREMCFAFRDRVAEMQAATNDKSTHFQRTLEIGKGFGDDFQRTGLRSDAYLIDHELRRRVGEKAVASIVGVPPSIFSATDRAPVSVLELATSGGGIIPGLSAMTFCVLADSLEQMAKVLPTR